MRNNLASMNEMASIFGPKNGQRSVADVVNAFRIIDADIQPRITKTIFRDLLTGLKVLTSCMQQPDEELAFSTIIQWLKLHLRIAKALSPKDSKLFEEFEKHIPPTISYVAVALYFTPANIEEYHFHLFQLSLELLELVTEQTLKKVANLKPGLIACFWNPIHFVGDFNTQLIGLRLTAKLLRCIEANQQELILEEICSTEHQVLKHDICSVVEVSNFHAARFENSARELLNNLNINFMKNVLVYSMRCVEVKFGGVASFYKLLHAKYLWVDLNYGPGTVTFNARYGADGMEQFIDVEVCVKIHKVKVNKKTLTVISNASPQFSKTLSNQDKLIAVRKIKFVLLSDEVLRLRENSMVLEYYNNTKWDNKGEHVTKSAETVSNNKDKNSTTRPPSNNKELIANRATTLEASTSDHFGKSFSLLIGTCDNRVEQHASQTMLESAVVGEGNTTSTNSLPRINNKLSHQDNREDLSLSSDPQDVFIPQTPPKTARKMVIVETPKSSLSRKGSKNQSHPIAEITRGTTKESSNKKKKGAQATKKNKRRYRNQKEKIRVTPPKRKQVNKVKPMNHLAKGGTDPKETIQEYIQNDSNLNSEVFARSSHRFSCYKDGNAEMPTSSTSRKTGNVFGISNDGFADPGPSYRKLEVLKPKVNDTPPKNLKMRKNIRKTPKTSVVENTSKANPEKHYHQESSSSKATKKFKPKTRKRKRPVLKKNTSGAVDDTIPSNANDFACNKEMQISSINSNGEPPKKKGKLVAKILRKKPKRDKENTTSVVAASDEEFNNCQKDVTKPNDILKSRHSNDESIMPTTTELPNSKLEKSPQHNDNVSNNAIINLDNNEIGIEMNYQTMADVINSLERTESQHKTWDNLENFFELSDIQESRRAVVPTEQVTLSEEIYPPIQPSEPIGFISPTLSDVLRLSSLCDPNGYNTLEEQSAATAHTDGLNGFNMSNLEKSEDSLETTLETIFNPDCLLFRRRSDDEFYVELDQQSNQSSALMENPFIMHNNILVESNVLEPNVQNFQLTTTSVTTREVTNNNIFLMQPTSICSKDIIPLEGESSTATIDQTATSETAEYSDYQHSDIAKYFNSFLETNKELDVVHNPPQDISELLEKYKKTMNMESKKILFNNDTLNDKLNFAFEKVTEIGKRLFNKSAKERKKLEASEKKAQKFLRQLNLQRKKNEKKAENLNRYNENMLKFLNIVLATDYVADIQKELDTSLVTLETVSARVRLELWKEYIKNAAEKFVTDISNLADLN